MPLLRSRLTLLLRRCLALLLNGLPLLLRGSLALLLLLMLLWLWLLLLRRLLLRLLLLLLVAARPRAVIDDRFVRDELVAVLLQDRAGEGAAAHHEDPLVVLLQFVD